MGESQKDLDDWMNYYNNDRTHQGEMCFGRTPLEALLDGKPIWAKKNLAVFRFPNAVFAPEIAVLLQALLLLANHK